MPVIALCERGILRLAESVYLLWCQARVGKREPFSSEMLPAAVKWNFVSTKRRKVLKGGNAKEIVLRIYRSHCFKEASLRFFTYALARTSKPVRKTVNPHAERSRRMVYCRVSGSQRRKRRTCHRKKKSQRRKRWDSLSVEKNSLQRCLSRTRSERSICCRVSA